MMEHKELLQMIEAVSPDDTAKLDEIDARVWCFIANAPYLGFERTTDYFFVFYKPDDYEKEGGSDYSDCPEHTRSRDVLKQIRPDLHMMITHTGECWRCVLSMLDPIDPFDEPMTEFEGLAKTEELAELHAIIQAIAYERSKCTA